MLITNSFVFQFVYEKPQAIFESLFGENWREKVYREMQIRKKYPFFFKEDTLLSIYPNGLELKGNQEYFESFMLGFALLNIVDQNRNNKIKTSSTMVGLVTQACLAMSKILELPLTLFFENIDEMELSNQLSYGDFEKIEGPLVIRDDWVKNGINVVDAFIQHGYVFSEKFDPTLIGEEPIEEQNDFILKPTSLFLDSLHRFEIKEF